MKITQNQTNPYQSLFDKHRERAHVLKLAPLKDRKKKLKQMLLWIYNHEELLKHAVFQDLQKPANEAAITEIFPLISELKTAISQLNKWAAPKSYASSLAFLGTQAKVHYEPKGTSLIISPWNYPILLTLGPFVSAIAAGCTVILKPSEYTPHTNQIFSQLVRELFDEDEVLLVEGEADVAQKLLELSFDHIFFTGSPQVGKLVMQAAAKNLSSVTLELGGKSPTIVDESADIKDAARKIVWGKWTNAGQTCIAPDYLMAHQSVIDQLMSEIKQQIEYRYGKEENYGGIISDKHLQRISAYLDDHKEKNGKVYVGGKIEPEKQRIQPTVVTDMAADSLLMKEEIFGPVLPVMPYTDLNHVIQYINERPKPLALYLFTKRKAHKKKIMNETSSGSLVFNDCVLQFGHPHMPMGGVNNSGIGKAHGEAGFQAFSHAKSVLNQRIGLTTISTIMPPYDNLKNRIIDIMLKYF